MNFNRVFAIGVSLNVVFVIVESAAGMWANSLALLADAGHNLSDVLGLLLAWAAHVLGSARPSQRRTYGWKSSSILAALFNAQILLIAVGAIGWEAIERFQKPAPASGSAMIVVAAIGVVINGATAWLFLGGRSNDLNIRGAYLHMAADAAVSLGVVIAGLVIRLTGSLWIDPVTSLVVAALILWSTWGLLRESLDLALHAVPRHIDLVEVKRCLERVTGVQAVHDLHVWAMSTTETALTAHLVSSPDTAMDAVLRAANEALRAAFGTLHTTLQIEAADMAEQCPQAPDHVV